MSDVPLDKVVKLLVGVLARVLNPAMASSVLIAAAKEAGIDNMDAYLSDPAIKKAASAPSPGGAKRGRKPKGEKGEAKVKKPRAITAYVMFVTKALDKMSGDPDYQKLMESQTEGGKATAAMSVAAVMWKALTDDMRETFAKAYQPLIDSDKAEWEETGHKSADKLITRMAEFEKSWDKATKAKMAGVLLPASKVAEVMNVAHASGSSPLALTSPPADDDDDSSDDSSSDDDDDEADAEAARKEAEEKKKAEEKKQKKSHKQEKPDGEHKQKKHKL